jgi:2-amino-4-hydroxy-6-hydroxymethyldihydropteridine diphosphokinase
MLEKEENAVLAYISLGSNVGDRMENMVTARKRLDSLPGIAFKEISSVYETRAIGMPGAGDFLNAVCSVAASVAPCALLQLLEETEHAMGRREKSLMKPRVIDLDLLMYGDREIAEEGLVLPHPRMHERRFVLVPLCEIAPDAIHPVLKKKICDILLELGDKDSVRFHGRFAPERIGET